MFKNIVCFYYIAFMCLVYNLIGQINFFLISIFSSDVGVKSVIISSLQSEFFHESNLFQTAIFAVIWKQENLLYSKKRLVQLFLTIM